MATAQASGTDNEAGKVAKVTTKLRVFEDFNLAYRLQEEEFGDHYDHNRHERRLVGSDTKKTKEEQELEDKYAAEYRAQVRRDLEQKDAQIAQQMQIELEREERRKLEELARYDQEVARRMATEEQIRRPVHDPTEDERLARQLQQSLNMGGYEASGPPPALNRGGYVASPPPPAEPYGFRSTITLPSGETPELRQALSAAVREEDAHFAKYMQDRELAKFEQRRERRRLTEEQRENEIVRRCLQLLTDMETCT